MTAFGCRGSEPGKDDVVIGFGPGVGTWKWMNDSAWVPLHGLSPEVMVTGNVDGL